MSKAQQPDERYLKNALQQADSTEEVACKYGVGTALGLEAHIAAKTIRAQHAHIADLEATHLRELAAYRTTAENLEAERSAIIAEKNDYKISLRAARAELAALKAAPAAQAVEPAAGAAQSGTVTYSDGTTATGPGSLPQVSPRQQRAAALIDSVEALLGGANGPTIQLRALLAAPAPAAVAVPEGWKLVPIEATQEMVDAWSNATGLPEGVAEQSDDVVNAYAARRDWAAMMGASPETKVGYASLKAAFETWAEDNGFTLHPHTRLVYDSRYTRDAWSGWQGHAALAATPPAQAQDVQRDAARYRGLRLMMSFEKSGKTGKTVMALSLDANATHNIHKDWMASNFDASVDRTVDAAIAAQNGGEA